MKNFKILISLISIIPILILMGCADKTRQIPKKSLCASIFLEEIKTTQQINKNV